VPAELQQHITFAALAVGVSEQWVLRAYCDDSWARDMARQVYSKIAETKQSPGNESVSAEQRGRDLSVRSAARLVAGLGQALLFGNAVRRWRHQAGDSQERLERAGAEHCPSSICRFRHRSENGPRRPRRVAWIVPAHCQRKGQPQLRAGRVATRPETAIARSRMPLEWGMDLATQVDELRAGGSRVETVFPDGGAGDVFDANALEPSTRLQAARGGYDQGRALAELLAEIWR
jgi:hypothetical protein